jgi:glycerophosphoryl diester phosphodiesterase
LWILVSFPTTGELWSPWCEDAEDRPSRGGGTPRENTLGSIEQAIEIGVGRVNRLTLSEIKHLRILDGQEIPTTEDVLACCQNRVGLVLELKAKGLAESIVQIVSSSEFRDPLISASFDHQDLARLRHLHPSSTIMPQIGRGAIDPDALAKLGAR